MKPKLNFNICLLQICLQEVKIVKLKGNHQTLLKDPNVAVIAKLINEILHN